MLHIVYWVYFLIHSMKEHGELLSFPMMFFLYHKNKKSMNILQIEIVGWNHTLSLSKFASKTKTNYRELECKLCLWWKGNWPFRKWKLSSESIMPERKIRNQIMKQKGCMPEKCVARQDTYDIFRASLNDFAYLRLVKAWNKL